MLNVMNNQTQLIAKVSGCSLVSAGFSIANIIGPQTFQSEDAPQYVFPAFNVTATNHIRYIPAKITLVAVNAASMVIATAMRIMYGRRNARANRAGTPARSWLEERMASEAVVEDVHDDKDFRYVY